MGLPISNFSTFLSLCDRQRDSGINKLFSQFKLTVIVLGDPKDPEIIDKFKTVNRMTGQDLLFITFTSSPYHYRVNFREWNKYEELDDTTRDRLRQLNDVSTIDDIGMADLARRFNLSPSHLPALIITNDLRAREAVVLRTTKEQISKQLVLLALEVAERNAPIDIRNLELVKSSPDALLCDFRSSTSEILTNAFGNIQLKENPNDQEAKDWNDKAVNDSLQRLNTMDDTSETALAEREEELMDYATNRLVQAQRTSPTASNNRFVIDENKMQGIESDTLTTLRTYNLLTRQFVSKPENGLPEDFKYDYSALSLYLSKVLENELAYSIVQQMRQVKGIPMPDYYCKLFKGKNDADYKVKTASDKAVDLNKKQGRYWGAPALGEMRMVYQKLAADGAPLYAFDDVFMDYIWQPLIHERNMAAHRNPIDWIRFDTTYNYFRRFIDEGYCNQLIEIKETLKPREEECIVLR